ncbi:MAG: hypothetical protein A2748_02405 [Candidatus Wildermuthbacteria bacterium RIFCSPHIGHO2_01_FULL_45_20]|nr:MAG: hypothetical protein A2748_02405 [Candidatus Wildermuthbacteria bacterium RIFCSPHIGHO2_01_FULL_45_20]
MYLYSAIAIGGSIIASFVVAFFGAWKDCLWESFSIRKFFRTPIVFTFCAIVLSLFFGQPTNLWGATAYILGAAGLERILTDMYKVVYRKKPSKFLRAGRDTGWLRERLRGKT